MASNSSLPSLYEYVRSLAASSEYREFEPDDSLHMPKETQFAFHIAATISDPDLFQSWAPNLIASGHPMFQEAVLRNPLATARHLQILIAGITPRPEILRYVVQHPNATPPIIMKVLDLTDGAGSTKVDTHIACRSDLTETHVRRLLERAAPGVFAVLATNAHVAEAQRVHAALMEPSDAAVRR